MKLSSIAVFCGSRSGSNGLYEKHACELGKLMGEQNIKLIYGGGNKGLMGAVANAVMDNGGEVIGVIPKLLIEWEHQHEGITDLRVVEDMHIRKRMMYELCDAAVILPGGNGTLDELFEMLTWNTLNIHNKKIILLNSAGFYDHLIAHIETMSSQGFLYSDWRERLIVCEDAVSAIGALA
ncbi:MAG: lysine decarboxylase family [Sediminibacterium sp.]|nr:lysine decarboxylase family [Sediminibacterium sp.]